MENRLVQYIEKLLTENTTIDMWENIHLPYLQNAFAKEYDSAMFEHFIKTMDRYNEEGKDRILHVILVCNDARHFETVIDTFKGTKNSDIMETILGYLRSWDLSNKQKEVLADFYEQSGIRSPFCDVFVNEISKSAN